ncbi:hypothetical protein [Cohnella sp. GCM10027633]|uniref:hypothetical protein n=1 Tax=unclassified Cohnella TaxID=2636738 RepID=UPI003641895B
MSTKSGLNALAGSRAQAASKTTAAISTGYVLRSRAVFSGLFAAFSAISSYHSDSAVRNAFCIIGALLVFAFVFHMTARYRLIDELNGFTEYRYKRTVYGATLLSLCAFWYSYTPSMNLLISGEESPVLKAALSTIVTLVMALCFFILWYFLLRRCLEQVLIFLRSLSLYEKFLLYGYPTVMAIASFLTLMKTSAFIYSVNDGEPVWDVIFNSDTSLMLIHGENVFTSSNAYQNDFRSLLFGVYATPFSMIVAPVTFIADNILTGLHLPLDRPLIFGYFMTIGQAALFGLGALLIYRLLAREMNKIHAAMFGVLYLASYPTLLFTMTIEQYAFSLATLLLFVYAYVNRANPDYAFVVAGTTLTSSFAMLPLALYRNKRSFKAYWIAAVKLVLGACFAIALFGQLYEFPKAFKLLPEYLQGYAMGEGLSTADKLAQYFDNLSSLFVAPNVSFVNGGVQVGEYEPTYRMISLVIAILAVTAIVVVRRTRLVAVSAYWMIVSIILFGIVGWGTAEEGLLLYTSYFSWCYLILIALLFARLFKKFPIAGSIVLTVAVTALLLYNATQIIDYTHHLDRFR